jgi:hypothetical protein
MGTIIDERGPFSRSLPMSSRSWTTPRSLASESSAEISGRPV